MKKIHINYELAAPFLNIILISIIFALTTKGQIFASNSVGTMVRQTLDVIIAGLGLLFVAAMGGTDITQGSLSALCAALAANTAVSLNIYLAVPVAILVGLTSGLFLGTVNARFKVPSFMASLAMLIGLRAMVSTIIGAKSTILPQQLKVMNSDLVKIPIVIALIVIILYIFNYTRFGAYCRAIGENENAAKFAGINIIQVKIAAYGLAGLLTGIASTFLLARVGGSSNTMGNGFEMRLLMALFIGGVPVSGGSGTKLYKMILGAFTITLLESGLVMSGASGALTQLIRGIILLGFVFLTIKMRSRVLLSKS